MTNRIYTNEKTCPLCHKNKAMFTLSLEGEKIQVCPTCYQIVKIESDRHKTKNIINDPKYTLDRIYQMLSDSVIEQNHAMQQIALTIYKHIQQKELIRTNALIVGPTGSGKTEVALNKLSPKSLYNIVIAKKDMWQEYHSLFYEQGKNLTITKETLQNACYDAYKNGTGVRGVHQELEMLLSKALFAAGQKIEV